MTKTATEIKIKNELLNNQNISIKIGTSENKKSPKTIYIIASFWAKMKKNSNRNSVEHHFKNIYKNKLKPLLKNNEFFPNENENIFICNMPEKLNFNNKSNFISLELYIHTKNIKNPNFPLDKKKNTILFNKTVELANIITNPINYILEEIDGISRNKIKV